MLKDFLFKRPDWFKHEGYWRLAQIFRIGPSAFCITLGVLTFFYTLITACYSCRYGYTILWFGASISLFVAIHFLIRLIVWIVDGFKNGGKPI